MKISVIPNGLQKYIAFAININLVFIGSMQFMNSSLDAFVKRLSEMNFKYLLQKFSDDLVELYHLYPIISNNINKTYSKDQHLSCFKI